MERPEIESSIAVDGNGFIKSAVKMSKSFQSVNCVIRMALVAISAFLLLHLSGCFEENTNANITITVTGSLSGKPREDIAVQLFLSKENAKDIWSLPVQYHGDSH